MSELNWEAAYGIALALIEAYPDANIEDIGYEQLFNMITGLPEFNDDPDMVNDGVLDDILREWYEETHNL